MPSLKNVGAGFLKVTSPRPIRILPIDLAATTDQFSDEIKKDDNRTTWELAKSIISHFLGKEWVTKYLSPDFKNSKLEDYFRLDFSVGHDQQQERFARIMNLAETLFNLQHIDGFDERCDLLRAGQVESTIAEIDFGRFLYMHDVNFSFVTPSGQRGSDFDYLITYADGTTACADAKCRMEDSAIDHKMIRHSLETARKNNLPKDKPGIVFVKVPQTWLNSAETRTGVAKAAEEWLRGTERIVLVVLYCFVEFFHNELQMTVHRHLKDEIQSEWHRFERTRDWRLFEEYLVPKEWAGMPPKWHRIFSTGKLGIGT